MQKPERFLAVAGNIGVGKSSFIERYAAARGVVPVYEPVDENPYLADFYADMPRWALQSQVFFLARRMRQHHELMRTSGSIVQDRSIYEDAEVFARNLAEQGTLSERDWRTYCELYASITAALTPPDAVLYLRASVPTLRKRIVKRGRSYEMGIPDAYLEGLNDLYERWTSSFTLAPVITVDTDGLDFVERPEDFAALLARLEE